MLFSACFPYPPEDTATDYGVPLKFDAVDGGFRVLVSHDILKKDWNGSYYMSNKSIGPLQPGDELFAVNGTRLSGSKADIVNVLSGEGFPRNFDFIRDTRGQTMNTAIRTIKKPKNDAANAVTKPARQTKGKKRRTTATPAGSQGKGKGSDEPRPPKAKRRLKEAVTAV